MCLAKKMDMLHTFIVMNKISWDIISVNNITNTKQNIEMYRSRAH